MLASFVSAEAIGAYGMLHMTLPLFSHMAPNPTNSSSLYRPFLACIACTLTAASDEIGQISLFYDMLIGGWIGSAYWHSGSSVHVTGYDRAKTVLFPLHVNKYVELPQDPIRQFKTIKRICLGTHKLPCYLSSLHGLALSEHHE